MNHSQLFLLFDIISHESFGFLLELKNFPYTSSLQHIRVEDLKGATKRKWKDTAEGAEARGQGLSCKSAVGKLFLKHHLPFLKIKSVFR